MRKLIKRVSAVVLATAMTVAATTSCFAADRWVSYFGLNAGWYEGAYGELTQQSDTSWTAKLDVIGWGGVWGAQVKDEAMKIEAGKEYTLSFNIESDTVDKWMFIKVANADDDLLWGDWVQVKKGKAIAYTNTVKVDSEATKIVFGIGGEFGDRTDEADMYELTSTLPNDGDANNATTLKLTDFSLEAAGAAEKEDNKKEDNKKEDDKKEDNKKEDVEEETEKKEDNGAVQTGDSAPIACAGLAILAAAGIVVFTRKREEA